MMNWLRTGRPWYAAGLAFECTECGGCCSGPEEGYVWIKPGEIAAAADALGIDVTTFAQRYTRKVGRRVSLIETANKDCIFLDGTNGGIRHCRIYAARPSQCRTWPFWPNNLQSPNAWAMAQRRCPGINRGPTHGLKAIEDAKSNT